MCACACASTWVRACGRARIGRSQIQPRAHVAREYDPHARTNARTQAHTLTHTHTLSHTHTRSLARTHAVAHRRSRSGNRIGVQTRAPARRRQFRRQRLGASSWLRVHECWQALAHSQLCHACTHTGICICICICIGIGICICIGIGICTVRVTRASQHI